MTTPFGGVEGQLMDKMGVRGWRVVSAAIIKRDFKYFRKDLVICLGELRKAGCRGRCVWKVSSCGMVVLYTGVKPPGGLKTLMC